MGRRGRAGGRVRAVVTLEGISGDLAVAVDAAHAGDVRSLERGIDRLIVTPSEQVDTAIAAAADRVLGALYTRGWLPADLVRAVGTDLRPWIARLIRAQAGRYPGDRTSDRWRAQVEALDDDPAAAHRHDEIRALVEVLAAANHLPDLPVLGPPPGVARPGKATGGTDDKMLIRVRALLAKAESTTFPDEADAYSAKAQQLITQHRIDAALVAGEVTDPDAPDAVRVGIDAPYTEAKSMLLHVVAEASGCAAVWSAEDGFSTVFGYAADLDAVQMLYASLLVQGTAAMVREGSARHDSPARTKTFRQSFMHAYALRIGTRLRRAATRTGEAAAAEHDRLLPALARREAAVSTAVERVFGTLATKGRSIRIDDERGWRSGTAFADRASLDER